MESNKLKKCLDYSKFCVTLIQWEARFSLEIQTVILRNTNCNYASKGTSEGTETIYKGDKILKNGNYTRLLRIYRH